MWGLRTEDSKLRKALYRKLLASASKTNWKELSMANTDQQIYPRDEKDAGRGQLWRSTAKNADDKSETSRHEEAEESTNSGRS